MAKTGRPKLDVDFEVVDQLCMMQCTAEEIAAVLKVSVDTLDRRIKENFGMTFAEYFKQKRVAGNMSLRKAQWDKAVHGGNTTMLIFLGKQYLGQADKIENINYNEFKIDPISELEGKLFPKQSEGMDDAQDETD